MMYVQSTATTSQEAYPLGTRIVEIPRGRRFVSRPLSTTDNRAPVHSPTPAPYQILDPVQRRLTTIPATTTTASAATVTTTVNNTDLLARLLALAPAPPDSRSGRAHNRRDLLEARALILNLLKKHNKSPREEILNLLRGSRGGGSPPNYRSAPPSSVSPVQWLFDAASSAKTAAAAAAAAAAGGSGVVSSPARRSLLPPSPSRAAAVGMPTPGPSPSSASSSRVPTPDPSYPSMAPDPWDFSGDEDLIDDAFLFRKGELMRRRNRRYLSGTKHLHDLHIVIPIMIPYGKITVEEPLGANYYSFSPKHVGARLLFGKGVTSNNSSTTPLSQTTTNDETPDPAGVGTTTTSVTPVPTNDSGTTPAPPPSTRDPASLSPICDVWASFLHVRLGTIYNVPTNQIPIVAEFFKQAFDRDLCSFHVPIAMDCRGIHPSSDELICQRASRPGGPVKSATYETHAFPASPNDAKRLRMLRRHIRRFAIRLITQLGFNDNGGGVGSSPTNMTLSCFDDPPPLVELHDNCKAEILANSRPLKICVREWSPLSDPEVVKMLWAGDLKPEDEESGVTILENEIKNKLQDKLIPSARVFLQEIRLEHDRLRMIDARWPNELVPGRRVADQSPSEEAPGPEETQAKFVFCRQLRRPRIEYGYLMEGGSGDPREVALNCRYSEIFKAHLLRYPEAGAPKKPKKKSQQNVAEEREGSGTGAGLGGEGEALGTISLEGGSGVGGSGVGESDGGTGSGVQSPSSAPSSSDGTPDIVKRLMEMAKTVKPNPDLSALALTSGAPYFTEPCRFFLKGSCARGRSCFFLHPADRKGGGSRPLVDVRHVVPNHPKFF